eukprot:2470439-Rhodomonas_salina.1
MARLAMTYHPPRCLAPTPDRSNPEGHVPPLTCFISLFARYHSTEAGRNVTRLRHLHGGHHWPARAPPLPRRRRGQLRYLPTSLPYACPMLELRYLPTHALCQLRYQASHARCGWYRNPRVTKSPFKPLTNKTSKTTNVLTRGPHPRDGRCYATLLRGPPVLRVVGCYAGGTDARGTAGQWATGRATNKVWTTDQRPLNQVPRPLRAPYVVPCIALQEDLLWS